MFSSEIHLLFFFSHHLCTSVFSGKVNTFLYLRGFERWACLLAAWGEDPLVEFLHLRPDTRHPAPHHPDCRLTGAALCLSELPTLPTKFKAACLPPAAPPSPIMFSLTPSHIHRCWQTHHLWMEVTKGWKTNWYHHLVLQNQTFPQWFNLVQLYKKAAKLLGESF